MYLPEWPEVTKGSELEILYSLHLGLLLQSTPLSGMAKFAFVMITLKVRLFYHSGSYIVLVSNLRTACSEL